MKWVDDWPSRQRRRTGVCHLPQAERSKTYRWLTPADTDEFNGSQLACNAMGRQSKPGGCPRADWVDPPVLHTPAGRFQELLDVPNLLLQKFPAPQFTATAKVAFTARTGGEKTGDRDGNRLRLSVGYQKPEAWGFANHLQECRPGVRRKKKARRPRCNAAHYICGVKVSEPSRLRCFSYSADGTNSRPPANAFTGRRRPGGLAPRLGIVRAPLRSNLRKRLRRFRLVSSRVD